MVNKKVTEKSAKDIVCSFLTEHCTMEQAFIAAECFANLSTEFKDNLLKDLVVWVHSSERNAIEINNKEALILLSSLKGMIAQSIKKSMKELENH